MLTLSSEEEWTDSDGTTWTRGTPRWLTESDAARLQLRESTLFAVERAAAPGLEPTHLDGDGPELTWMSLLDRKTFWKAKVAGHVDVANGLEPPFNEDGITFRASVWTDERGRRLILISRWR